MKKNTATTIMFFASTDTGEHATSIPNNACKISVGGNAPAPTTNQPTAVGAAIPGLFKLQLTASETNADVLAIYVSGSGIEPISILLTTDENYSTMQDNITAIQTAATTIQTTLEGTLTTNLSGSSLTAIRTGIAQEATLAAIQNTVATINTKTANLPANPAARTDIPTASAIASSVLGTNVGTVASPADFSLYTLVLGSLNSTVTVDPGTNLGTWIIKDPNYSTNHIQKQRQVRTSSDAKPIIEIS